MSGVDDTALTESVQRLNVSAKNLTLGLDRADMGLTILAKRNKTTKIMLAVCTVFCLVLIGTNYMSVKTFKDSRYEANTAYSAIVQQNCEQRSQTWDAIQVWIQKQIVLLQKDDVTNQALKAERMEAYTDMLKSFPDVDCSKLGTGLAGTQFVPKSLQFPTNLASR